MGNGDLIGLFRHSNLEERFLALMRAEGEQVGGRLLVGSGSAYGFAVQGNRILWGRYQCAAYPVSQSPFDLLRIQARKQFAVQRIAGTQKPARSEQVGEQIVLITAPLPDSQG